MKIIALLAMDRSRLIGSSGGLPWHLPEDMARMKQLTMGHILVMGRNTYFSLHEKYRPLPGRRNIVITRTAIEGVETYVSIDEFLDSMSREGVKQCFLFGGAQLYNAFFSRGLVDRVECTLVDGHHEGDIFVDEWRDQYEIVGKKGFSRGAFLEYRHNREIQQERKRFDEWNEKKKQVEFRILEPFFVNTRDVWYVSFGKNIGMEMQGKAEQLRPVLVLKQVGNLYFVVPLTTHGKSNTYHHTIRESTYTKAEKKPDISRANLSQIRMLDIRRFIRKIAIVSEQDMTEIQKKIKTLLF